jgi:hypothetical protein
MHLLLLAGNDPPRTIFGTAGGAHILLWGELQRGCRRSQAGAAPRAAIACAYSTR